MFAFKSLLLFSTFISITLAVPSLVERNLPSGTVVCGSHTYSVDAIQDAINAGVEDLNSGDLPDNYPHQFSDFSDEVLDFLCGSDEPWYEFPILPNNKIYTSGSPGADHVIFTSYGTYCAVVTHTGTSSRNGFVAYSGD